jgi:hypothetical protein
LLQNSFCSKDQSTTLGKLSTLTVYIKTFLDEEEEIIFLDLNSEGSQKAETIMSLSFQLSFYIQSDSKLSLKM